MAQIEFVGKHVSVFQLPKTKENYEGLARIVDVCAHLADGTWSVFCLFPNDDLEVYRIINKEDILEKDPTEKENLTDQIYDALMGNVGMSEWHTPFPTKDVHVEFVNNTTGTIQFVHNNKLYQLKLTEEEK